jgi:hypothetical protein
MPDHISTAPWLRPETAPQDGKIVLLFGLIQNPPEGINFRHPVIVSGAFHASVRRFRPSLSNVAFVEVQAWKPILERPKRKITKAQRDGSMLLLYGAAHTAGVEGKTEQMIATGYFDGIDNSFCATIATWTGPFIDAVAWEPLGDKPTFPLAGGA